MYRRLFAIGACTLLFLGNAQAQEDLHPYLTDEFVLYAGTFFPRLDFNLTIDGSIGDDNVGIDFEEQLDMPATDEIFDVELNWRFGQRWSLRTQYFKGGQSGSTLLESDLQWGDETFVIGTEARAATNFEILRVFFGYALDSDSNVDGGIGVGAHHLGASATIRGTLTSNGMTLVDARRTARTDVWLPNIGGWYSRSWSDKWAFTSRLDWLEASIGDVRGSIVNLSAGINYQLFEHMGVGLSYQDFTLRLRLQENLWRGRAKISYRGAFAYLTINW